MALGEDERTYRFKALTDLWTGSVDGKHDRTITTGLLGYIRWWFEVLVRGLDGSACDPTKTKCEGRNHCAVCELFGCTGWAGKFRFEVLDENGEIKTDQIKQNQTFSLRFRALRPIRIEEWMLLDTTLRLIAMYGAIGGKTVFKPTDEPNRANSLHHKDFGLVRITKSKQFDGTGLGDLKTYLSKWRKINHGDFAWASLQHFWCVNGKYLRRQNGNNSTFNRVLGRQEAKKRGQHLANRDEISKWLVGSQRESKKVFSFKNPARTFGFVNPRLIDFDAMKQRLQGVWGKDGWEFQAGEEIIDQLLPKEDCS